MFRISCNQENKKYHQLLLKCNDCWTKNIAYDFWNCVTCCMTCTFMDDTTWNSMMYVSAKAIWRRVIYATGVSARRVAIRNYIEKVKKFHNFHHQILWIYNFVGHNPDQNLNEREGNQFGGKRHQRSPLSLLLKDRIKFERQV